MPLNHMDFKACAKIWNNAPNRCEDFFNELAIANENSGFQGKYNTQIYIFVTLCISMHIHLDNALFA